MHLNGISPCMEACPLANDIPKINTLLLSKGLKEAALYVLKYNPFPSITSRVCPGFCEESCNRSELDEAINIKGLNRFIGDRIIEDDLFPAKENFISKKVAIIGSGPAGLSAAWFLSILGMEVSVFERETTPGGMLSFGIPSFRLKRETVQENLRRIEEIGITIYTQSNLSPEDIDELCKEFDAILVATGLSKPRFLQIRGAEYAKSGIELLKEYNLYKKLPEGRKFVVIGGGNAAIDVARVLKREGKNVTLVCVEHQDEMPAIKEEVKEAIKESVKIIASHGVREILFEQEKKKIIIGKVKIIGEKDGLKEVKFISNNYKTILCDEIVMAVGQEAEKAWPERKNVFMAGEILTGPSTVAGAIASGREAAYKIKAYLEKKKTPSLPEILWQRDHLEKVEIKDLNTAYFPSQKRVNILDQASALEEAKRCFSCGYCNCCGNCWIFCPDVAVIINEKPEIDKEHCKGCGICSAECPRGIIFMQEKS